MARKNRQTDFSVWAPTTFCTNYTKLSRRSNNIWGEEMDYKNQSWIEWNECECETLKFFE